MKRTSKNFTADQLFDCMRLAGSFYRNNYFGHHWRFQVDDMVQEVGLKLWTAFETRTHIPEQYFWKIVKNFHSDVIRRLNSSHVDRHTTEFVNTVDEEVKLRGGNGVRNDDDLWMAVHLSENLPKAIMLLTPLEFTVYNAYFNDDLTYVQIQQAYCIPAGTVRNCLKRGVQKILTYLEMPVSR